MEQSGYTVYTSAGVLSFGTEWEFRTFCAMYTEVNAGGGLVRRADGSYLMIKRHGHWDLPKGHQEEGESIEECALREVEEETGLKGLRLGRLIAVTHHTYNTYGPSCIKHTSWYEMEYDGDADTVPQTEEDITEAVWVSEKEAPTLAGESYPSIALVVATALGSNL